MAMLLLSTSLAFAKDRALVSGSGYALGFAADLFFRGAVSKFSEQYQIINDEKNKTRIDQLLQSIFRYSGHNFNQAHYNVVIIRGESNTPNAYTSGKNLYATQSLCDLLDDRELTAVLAHEMAHAEMSHLLKRIIFIVGSPGFAVYNYFSKGGSNNPQEILAEAQLGTEIEADCIAAKWLMHMRAQGQMHHADDLNLATFKLFVGSDFLKYLDPSDPPVIRYQALKNKLYENDQCGL